MPAEPRELDAADLVDKYDRLPSPENAITTAPIDRAVLRTAAQLRRQLEIKLMDAIHPATAIRSRCDFSSRTTTGREPASDRISDGSVFRN